MTSQNIDALTEDDLRQAGSMKWTLFPDMIGAFVAEMDFGLAPPIKDAVNGAMEQGLTGYLPPHLADALAKATSDRYARAHGWDVSPQRVHHVPDVIAAFEFAIEQYTQPGGAIIVPTPAYMPFLMVPQMHGRRVIEVPSIEVDGRWTIDHEAVTAAFADGGELFVLCNPHNPLGTVATRDELHRLADTIDAVGGRVFSDEIHAPLVYAPATHIPYASISEVAAGHTLTAASASKAWNLAGLKCAQVIISNDADAALWKRAGNWAGHGTSTIGAVANVAAYNDGEEWLADITDYLDGNRRLLAELVAEQLPNVGVTMPEGTYIAMLDFRQSGLTGDLGRWFREHAGVAMTDGAACGQAAVGYTRFVFAMPRPMIREAVRRIAAALA
ncbi:aminotransferase class I/II-fold pyridoxal phosphate-dependent enzyme [Microbacterium sp.]|uniref:MalY/PatB family protein n=1 Tax=Microbacterium sp. TaxID=51671 RepID=UPI002606E32C|nr:aminotransferase class I/II-fold pyridoxal phosphate-dependent enzyme [Microbacterium sp.]